MTHSSPSLGVSALLDELLADEADEAPKSAGQVPGDIAAAASKHALGAHFMANSRAPHSAPSNAVIQEAHDENASNPSRPVEPAGPTEESVSQQLAELCGEMDSCLDSLSRWETERQNQREVLKAKLAAQYGFNYDDEDADRGLDMDRLAAAEALIADDEDEDADGPDMFARPEGDDGPDMFSRPEGDDRGMCVNLQISGQGYYNPRGPRSGESGLTGELFPSSPPDSSGLLPGPGHFDDASYTDDEVRLARLRLEVENLRMRELQMHEGEASPSTGLEASMRLGSNLSDWVSEVDAVVRDMSFAGLDGPAGEYAGMEYQLSSMRDGLGQIEDGMDSARSRIEAEMKELESLLLEQDAIQALHARVAELPLKSQN